MLDIKHCCNRFPPSGRWPVGMVPVVGDQARKYGAPAAQSNWDSVDYLLADWERERPDLDFGPLAVIYRLGRVRRLLEVQMAEVYANHGLTAADFLVVVTLRRSGAPYRMPQARLMDALGLTSGTVSLRLDRLVKASVVVREPDPEDRRGSLIRLSAKGLQLFDSLAPEHLANEERLLSALTDEERTTLADLLRHLLVSLEPSRQSVQSDLGLRVESAAVARKKRIAVGLSDVPGLLLTAVEPGSPAEIAGLQRGDLIVEIAAQPVRNAAALTEALDAGDSVELTVLRGDEPRSVILERPDN